MLNPIIQIQRRNNPNLANTLVGDNSSFIYIAVNEDPYFPLNNVDRFVSCAFCNKVGSGVLYYRQNITNTLHFQCHECENFYICKDCMLKRCENETHKCTHGYHVNENLKSFCCFDVIIGKKNHL